MATGRNVFDGDESSGPSLIAAGQVVRIEGKLLFSEDLVPAPGGSCEIVLSDLDNVWVAIPREDGHFTLDILVPNLPSGYLDASMSLDSLPGLAEDETETSPRLQLSVDGTPPEIREIAPTGDVRIDQASQVQINLLASDSSGFDEDLTSVLHYRIRAGSSEISRGSVPLSELTEIQNQAMWSGKLDLTDGGATALLPGYLVDVWITGSDSAGNPYENYFNSETQPYDTWRLVRIGPEIDLTSSTIKWNDPSPTGGEIVTLTIEGTNELEYEGEVKFVIQNEVSPGIWADVDDAETDLNILPNSTYDAAIDLMTFGVDSTEVERYRLVARDGHIDVDILTLESLIIQPYQARDGEALGQQIEESQLTFLLYLAALFGLIFGTIMLVLYRQDNSSENEDVLPEQEQTDLVVESMTSEKSRSDQPPPPIPVTPPPVPTSSQGLKSPPPMPPGLQSPSPPVKVASPVSNPQPLQWSDEQLISQGWSTEQIATWRSQQAQSTYQQSTPHSDVTGGAAGATYSERVVSHVMQKYGITDRQSFLAAAEFFDSDGNRYLTTEELEKTARSLGEGA